MAGGKFIFAVGFLCLFLNAFVAHNLVRVIPES
jgi:hypothetical protein